MKKIIKKIKANGGKIYLVGGAVRDQIMGVEPYDLDYVVTGLTIDQMVSTFGDCISGTNAPVWQTEFGEIALARKERRNGIGYNGFQFYTSPSITIEEDLLRRDFTINAMAIDLETLKLIDPFNGKADIKRKIIGHINQEGFLEDPIRVLRVARFATRLGFTINDRTVKLCEIAATMLYEYKMERISLEFTKALEEGIICGFIENLIDMGVIEETFPIFKDFKTIPAGKGRHGNESLLEHTKTVCSKMPVDCISQFVGLMHDIGKILTPQEEWPSHHGHAQSGVKLVQEFIEKYKLPNSFKIAKLCCQEHMRFHEIKKPGKKIKAFAILYKTAALPYFINLVRADASIDISTDCRILEDVININYGKILIKEGYAPGVNFGELILQRQIKEYKRRNICS